MKCAREREKQLRLILWNDSDTVSDYWCSFWVGIKCNFRNFIALLINLMLLPVLFLVPLSLIYATETAASGWTRISYIKFTKTNLNFSVTPLEVLRNSLSHNSVHRRRGIYTFMRQLSTFRVLIWKMKLLRESRVYNYPSESEAHENSSTHELEIWNRFIFFFFGFT